MKSKLFIYAAIVFLLASFASAEKYFVLDINYISGSLTFNSISLKEIDRTVKYPEISGFLIKLKSFEDLDLQKIYYDMQINKNYQIYIPYNKEAARIEVYNPSNSKVMDIDISSFADTCGNKICEDYESYESCTKDCSSGGKDDFCDGIKDGICDPDCTSKTDSDCAESQKSNTSTPTSVAPPAIPNKTQPSIVKLKKSVGSINYFLWGSLIAAGIIPAIIFTFVRKRKEHAVIDTLKQYILQNIQRGFTLQQIKNTLYQEGYKESEIDKAVKSI